MRTAILAAVLMAGCAESVTTCEDRDGQGYASVTVYVESTAGCAVDWTDSVMIFPCEDVETSCGDVSAVCRGDVRIDMVSGETAAAVGGCEIRGHVTSVER